MRAPFTRFGLPQVIVYPLLVLVLMVVLFAVLIPVVKPVVWILLIEVLFFLVFIWMLSFFRDPKRKIIGDETVLYSPADGTITDITPIDAGVPGITAALFSNAGKGEGARSTVTGQALRIGMFLSVFNVHINRVPCSVRIENVNYKKGQYKNAMSEEASRVNESNDITMLRLAEPYCRLLVRQISGAIARHIVCEGQVNDEYRQGEAFGMIKFGSRTELYIPVGNPGTPGSRPRVPGAESNENLRTFEVKVKVGDKVRAGLTPLVRYCP